MLTEYNTENHILFSMQGNQNMSICDFLLYKYLITIDGEPSSPVLFESKIAVYIIIYACLTSN